MYKVLLVCVESTLIVPLRETFLWESCDCRLVGGTSDEEAGLQLISLLRPDIVITDTKMISQSNNELIEKVIKTSSSIKLIVIADRRDYDSMRSCLQYGASSFIIKPVTAADLRKKLTIAVNELKSAHVESEEKKTLKFWSGRDKVRNDMEYVRMHLAGDGLEPELLNSGYEYLDLTFLNGGYSVIALQFDRRAVMQKNRLREDELSERISWIIDDVTESKLAYSLCTDADDYLYVLLNFNLKSDYNNQAIQRIAEQTANRLTEELETETVTGTGFYCRRYEMIPFSRNEAIRSLARKRVSGTMGDILQYIDVNFTSPLLSNEEIAKASFLNYSYLCTKFKQEMSVSVNRYITQYRLARAIELLESGETSVPELARRVGFSDTKYFTKCFRDEFGMTPGQYIRKHPDEPISRN